MIRVVRQGAESGRFAGLAEIVLDRADKRNALTPEMIRQIVTHAETLDHDDSAKAIVLRGEGRVFCAGFDLAMCQDDDGVLKALLRELSLAIVALKSVSKPVVIAAHGAAIAGACALLTAGDLVVTDLRAKLGYPVVPLGISPAVTGPTLVGRVGLRATRQLLLDPALITGEEARRIGLVDLCVDIPEDVTPRAQIEAMKLADKPRWAFGATKRWVNEIESAGLDDDAMNRALDASLSLVGSDEQHERMKRFLGAE